LSSVGGDGGGRHPSKAMFHVKHEGWASHVRALGIRLSQEQGVQLERFASLLLERAIPLGMIASTDAERLWERHLTDSLRAAVIVRPTESTAYDLGSGAGLPGIPVAIACPRLEVRLVEPRRKRAAFLELATSDLWLSNVCVLAERSETLRDRVDLCFARAFGSPRASWEAADPLLSAAGRLVYFAGERFDPASLPTGVAVDIRPPLSLARSGPLVIMTRQ